MEKLTLILDQEYLKALLKLLATARKSVDILAYSFAIGSASGKLTESGAPFKVAHKIRELKQKRPGLKIRLYVEGFRETVERNRVTADFLEEAGVEIRYGATHAKGFCVDGKALLFGSTNLSNQSIMKNREANLLIRDKKTVKEFLRYFDFHWEGGGHGGIALDEPMLADGSFKPAIIDLINKAKKRIDFSIYFFNDRDIERALIKAHKRGVKISGLIHEHRSFALSYIRANQATRKRLKAAGIRGIFFGPTNLFSHSKYIVIDAKEVALGTGNWLLEDVFIHPQLYVTFADAKIAKGLINHLGDQLQFSRSQPIRAA